MDKLLQLHNSLMAQALSEYGSNSKPLGAAHSVDSVNHSAPTLRDCQEGLDEMIEMMQRDVDADAKQLVHVDVHQVTMRTSNCPLVVCCVCASHHCFVFLPSDG